MPETRDAPALRCTLIVLRCAHLDAARSFYEALGAHFVEEKHGEGPRHYAATFGGMTLELYPGEADVGTRVGFAVADVDAAVSTLQALGASVRVAPRDSPWGRRAVVLDPDGRRVELHPSQARERDE